MNRIEKKFRRLRTEGRKGLIPFITAGDPSLGVTEKLICALESAGADIIELGIPFSDPMADGPVIQAASERALKKGTTLEKVLRLVQKIRRKSSIPIVLMGYFNPILAMGIDRFAERAALAGVDGVLVVDLPPEEAVGLRKKLKEKGLNQIFLLAPTSDSERIGRVVRLSSGYLYYVSLTGITGAKLTLSGEIDRQIRQIRKRSPLPIVIGFGITSPNQAGQAASLADGVVIGSALVRLIGNGSPSGRVARASRLLSSIRNTLDS